MKIALVDTGVNKSHPQLRNYNIVNYQIETQGGKVAIKKGGEDDYGHGTAVCGIILNHCPEVEVLSFQMYKSGIDSEDLFAVLNYIHFHYTVSIIHLSIGCQMCCDLNKFKLLCHEIVESGCLIVAAYDNEGSMSYPASFECVIGVDWSNACKGKNDTIFIEKSKINILAKGINQRVLWNRDSKYMIVSGSSFAAAHVTGIILSKMAESDHEKNTNILQETLDILRNNSFETINMSIPEDTPKASSYGNIGLFPLNKEIESILCFHDQVIGEITHIFDVRFFGRIGQKINELIYTKDDYDIEVENVEYLDKFLPEIDTMVIGFTEEIKAVVGVDYKNEILELCRKENVKCFFLDEVPEFCTYRNVYSPKIGKRHIRVDNFQKLRVIGVPILMIAGTSSKQGKFSLQLSLRKYFEENFYKVGQWATEPQAQLFGIDEVLPTGYGSHLDLPEKELIEIVNYQLGNIEDKGCDIIIAGTQSFQLPYNLIHANMYPAFQNAIISALQPDAILLCVNMHDELEYIRRTINYMEAVTMGKVVGIAVFPVRKKRTWSATEFVSSIVPVDEIKFFLADLEEKIKVKTFCIDDVEQIGNTVIDYFE